MAQTFQIYQPAVQAPFERLTWGARWGSSFGMIKDELLQQTILGVMARFPNFAPLDALGQIGLERGIVQGPSETTPHYIARLLNAWGAWTIGGTYWGLLAELYGAGYTTAYIAASNGYIYGPSSGVVVPDPINGIAGTPPAFSQLPPWYTNGSAPAGSEWAATTAYALGSVVTPTSQPGTYFIAIVHGTSGSSQPTWPGAGGTVVDGGVTWAYVGNYDGLAYNPPWTFSSANGQGDNSGDVPPTANGVATGGPPDPTGAFWSRFVVLFDPVPSGWTDIVNPPSSSTSPGSSEISLISSIIAKWKPGKSTCVGILALTGARACWAWPLTTTTNIPFSCWLSRAILTGDAPTNTAWLATSPASVYSWLPHTAVASSTGYVFTTPSSYYQTLHTGTQYLYSSPISSGTTGFTEPTWPTTLSNTVTDNGITWTCIATLSNWSTGTSSTCFDS